MRRLKSQEHTETDRLYMGSCNQHYSQNRAIEDVDTAKLDTHNSDILQYLNTGVILHGKYRVSRIIGQGGFGITYEGIDLNLDMHIAIKEYFPKAIASRYNNYSKKVTYSSEMESLYEQGMRNFLKEAKNMAKFAGQENFVYVYDYFSENGTAYIIMEYIPGQNLKHFLEEHGKLSFDEVMTIITPVLNAVEMIHERNMIHRDISPSNIMILPDGKVKLLDFGAVREVSAETQSLSTMSSVYKYGYSPIEQQTRDMRQGTFSDVYAICATIYKMLTGFIPPSPFARLSGEEILIPPSKMGVQIATSQEETLMEGLAIYGTDRIQTVGELRRGLFGAFSTYGTSKSKTGFMHRIPLKNNVVKILIVFAFILSAVLTIKAVNTKNKEVFIDNEIIDGPNDIPANAIAFNGHSYYLYVPDSGTWDSVLRNCAANGGYPAVINNKEENEFLFKYMKERGIESAFIGYTDIDEEGTWKWVYGKESDFQDWGINARGQLQPNKENRKEDWAQLDTRMLNGHWNDSEYGSSNYAYFCEWDT